MSIKAINANQTAATINQAEQTNIAANKQTEPASKQQTVSDIRDFIDVKTGKTLYADLQEDKAIMNYWAKNIRTVDDTMAAIGKHIESMQSDLKVIVKNYPPFPLGNTDRIEFLKSYSSLRQQIDAMTIPATPDANEARKIMADPLVVPDAGGGYIPLGSSGIGLTIKAQEVHTAPSGLNIPALADSVPEATNQDILVAIGNLESAGKTLEQRREGLAGDAAAISEFLPLLGSLTAFMSGENRPEIVNIDKSVEVKQILQNHVTEGLTRDDSKLKKVFPELLWH